MTSDVSALSTGDKIPLITLSTAFGEKILLASYARKQGKRNLLLFFFRTGTCGVCVGQLQETALHHEQIMENNAAVLAISLDDAIIQSQTADKISRKFPILLDPDSKTAKLFDVFNPQDKLAKPSIFLIGPDRRILYQHVGKSVYDRPAFAEILRVVKHYSGLLPTRDEREVTSGAKAK